MGNGSGEGNANDTPDMAEEVLGGSAVEDEDADEDADGERAEEPTERVESEVYPPLHAAFLCSSGSHS